MSKNGTSKYVLIISFIPSIWLPQDCYPNSLWSGKPWFNRCERNLFNLSACERLFPPTSILFLFLNLHPCQTPRGGAPVATLLQSGVGCLETARNVPNWLCSRGECLRNRFRARGRISPLLPLRSQVKLGLQGSRSVFTHMPNRLTKEMESRPMLCLF